MGKIIPDTQIVSFEGSNGSSNHTFTFTVITEIKHFNSFMQ